MAFFFFHLHLSPTCIFDRKFSVTCTHIITIRAQIAIKKKLFCAILVTGTTFHTCIISSFMNNIASKTVILNNKVFWGLKAEWNRNKARCICVCKEPWSGSPQSPMNYTTFFCIFTMCVIFIFLIQRIS